MRIVIALGGNALLRRDQAASADNQYRNVQETAASLAPLMAAHELVIVHGNGPQVGLLALQSEAYRAVPAYPLDVLSAETVGMVGYMLEQALSNASGGLPAATLLTQVRVDPHDPAFGTPSKPVGPVYERQEAERLARERGWSIAADGASWRRVVASPEPRQVIELNTIRLLVERQLTVICGGGGGIPVVLDDHGALHGVEAVVDKDLTAELLARELQADALLLLTDVAAVELDRGTDRARPLAEATPAQIRALDLPAGSMGPKAEAAARFVEATGGRAVIGALTDARTALRGGAGTRVVPEG